jgi:cytochrome c biogenesis protein CcmG, thiol:disulfide interchange protein DsbE
MDDKGTDEKKGSSGTVIAVIVIIVVVVVGFVMFGKKGMFEPIVAGKVPPAFELPDLEGNMVSLSSYKGKVIFLNFWATWCKPCEEEMPSMEYLYKKLQGENFEMVAVSIDSKGPGAVQEFVEKYGISFPVLHDRKGKIKELYKTTGVPETFIIDQNGVVAEKVWGPRDWSGPYATKVIRDLLNSPPKPSI